MDSKNTAGSVVKSYRKERITEWEKHLEAQSRIKPVHCTTRPLKTPQERTMEQFYTGSKYEGAWDELGMSGKGRYTFPNGVIYNGGFVDGMFEGAGDLLFADGAVLRALWRGGKLLDKKLFFADGMEYKDKNWPYCTMPDRRFTVEYSEGLQAAGATFLTAAQPTPRIPPGHLDTVDGFFNPRIKMVMRPDDVSQILRAPGTQEQAWIEAHCRRATDRDAPVGARAHLYEAWEEPLPLSRSAATSATAAATASATTVTAAATAPATTATAAATADRPCTYCHPGEDDPSD